MRILSGIKPTGTLTLGNYIGAIKNFVKLQEEYKDAEVLVFIADLHALTTPQDKQELRNRKKEIAGMYLACGLDKEKTILFNQSEVKEHLELGYIMECTSYIGEMERMTQYKDKKLKQTAGIKTSLLTYPALMAADILLYDASLVPIGDDQKQHLELTRNLAVRFNNEYGETFTVPEGFTPKVGKRIMGLQDPTKKMSKSDEGNPKNYISLFDNPSEARNKIKSAVTDSLTNIKYDAKEKPGISNLLNIYSALTDTSISQIEKKYANSNYMEFKNDLGEIVFNFLSDLQNKYNNIISSGILGSVLDKGAAYASMLAKRKIEKVYKKVGLNR
ncbi:MAG: tryptophan--tRNA ligase [Acholeplasmatales bacterium]|jgi:tryptophanyl-tRNA synthetase|nr:tryptophan--tRNA ligase [Acholeplasmatales bacterium]